MNSAFMEDCFHERAERNLCWWDEKSLKERAGEVFKDELNISGGSLKGIPK